MSFRDASLPADRSVAILRSDDDAAAGNSIPPNADPVAAAKSSAPHSVIRRLRIALFIIGLLLILVAIAFFVARYQIGREMRANLPQIDGSLTAYGLNAPVTVERDAHGVPHIHASSLDDLIFAQGFVTAQDRLWQMDLLRRHAAGELAAVFGRSLLAHDRLQRTLQIRTAADNAIAALPADQKHWLEVYALGVNSSMVAQHDHLPIEFRIFGYRPAPWSPRDSILVELAMVQDLTTGFNEKLGREALAAHLPPELIADLYPVGSWRDHPPGAPIPDVTAPQPEIKDIPLDESQSKLHIPAAGSASAYTLLALNQALVLFHPCETCVSGSNGWAVSGSHSASGKPMLSSDMHLSLAVPDTWYEADLDAPSPAPQAEFHAAGVTLPGVPFIVAGHNAHIAWGFTNLGADVQDLYIEHTRGTPSGAEYQTAGGDWLPLSYRTEVIQIRGGASDTLNVPITRHGNQDTPIITSISPREQRSISLRWTIYDPATVTFPLFAVDTANDWTSALNAFAAWGGPPQNLMYADDQGHIGYHTIGRIPIRGDANNPSPLSPVPTDATAPDAAAHEWAGYIPFDQLPQAFDPPDGVLATANARVTLDGYRFPVTLNWMAPYRTERIYRVLESTEPKPHLTPTDMLALQNDVFSELDQVLAQRYAYAIDHASGRLKDDKRLHQAADLLRAWNGHVDANAAAPAIVNAARAAFWPLLLIPKLVPQAAPHLAQGADLNQLHLPADTAQVANLWTAYTWGERSTVEENLVTNTPARWLPAGYANWNDFLAAVVERGLHEAHAPRDLSTWQQGKASPLDIQHPIFSSSQLLESLIGVPTGTGLQSQSGDGTTVKQVGSAFGPSELFTTDLGNLDQTTLNLVLGQSGNPASPWFMDQFDAWLHGRTYPLPFTPAAAKPTIAHTLTLTPR
jgi:penicillin amidase